jgi:predicted GNAT family N-acyltransferase
MYRNVDSLTPTQIHQLLGLYQQTWWAKQRELADVQRMLSQSTHLFGICHGEADTLVAFTRVLSDGVYRGIIFDVVVDEQHRGQGLGRSLIEQVIHHPELAQVENLYLFCTPDMVEFYQKYGFEAASQLLMARSTRLTRWDRLDNDLSSLL